MGDAVALSLEVLCLSARYVKPRFIVPKSSESLQEQNSWQIVFWGVKEALLEPSSVHGTYLALLLM